MTFDRWYELVFAKSPNYNTEVVKSVARQAWHAGSLTEQDRCARIAEAMIVPGGSWHGEYRENMSDAAMKIADHIRDGSPVSPETSTPPTA